MLSEIPTMRAGPIWVTLSGRHQTSTVNAPEAATASVNEPTAAALPTTMLSRRRSKLGGNELQVEPGGIRRRNSAASNRPLGLISSAPGREKSYPARRSVWAGRSADGSAGG